MKLFDVKFQGQRILYELGLQEAIAHYAGNDPVQSGTSYMDTYYGFGPYAFSQIPGYDMPGYAYCLNTTFHASELSVVSVNLPCTSILDMLQYTPLDIVLTTPGSPLRYHNIRARSAVSHAASLDERLHLSHKECCFDRPKCLDSWQVSRPLPVDMWRVSSSDGSYDYNFDYIFCECDTSHTSHPSLT